MLSGIDSTGIPVSEATSGRRNLAGKLVQDTDVSYEIDEQTMGPELATLLTAR